MNLTEEYPALAELIRDYPTLTAVTSLYLLYQLYSVTVENQKEKARARRCELAKEGKMPNVVIIGAGFSGMCLGIKLKQAGIPFVILEKNHDVGGTWLLNTYPGCQCDVPAHLYSFSFELNPNWSQPYAPQPEILEYCRNVAKKYGLYEHIRFKAEVASTLWVESEKKWHTTLKSGEVFKSNFFAGAGGGLHFPSTPKIPASEIFEGESLHSASWDPSVNYEGKNVVCIGSAASAIQLIPHVAEKAKFLTIVQRTPNWIGPQRSPVLPHPLTGYSRIHKTIFNWFPWILRLHRILIYIQMEMLFMPLNLFGNRKTSVVARFAESTASRLISWYMRKQLGDSKKADYIMDVSIPKYPVGCKRILRSEIYMKSLVRDNVDLIAGEVKEMKKHSVILDSGKEVPTDVIIFATGFEVGSIGDMEIDTASSKYSKRDLFDKVESFYGMSTPAFPNAFQLVGPNTGLGHNSIIFMIETEVDAIVKIITKMADENLVRVELKKSALDKYSKFINHAMNERVWKGSCNSWYQSADGRVPALWPSSTIDFWYQMKNLDIENSYEFQKA